MLPPLPLDAEPLLRAKADPARAPKRTLTERVGVGECLTSNAALLRNILDSAMDAIITIDNMQHIVLFNAAAETMFGCARQDAINQSIASLLPARLRIAVPSHIRRFGGSTMRSRRMGSLRFITGLRSNGEEFPVDASISQVIEKGRKFYTIILRDISQSVQTAQALRQSKEELHEFASAAHTIREQEKSRIARELHDELGQSLTALKMDVNWLQDSAATQQSCVAAKLASMAMLLDGMVAATRRIATDLRPLMLDDLGLIPAVEWLVQDFSQRSGIAYRLHIGEPSPDLQDPHATAVFRILQESLNNVVKHATATHVQISLTQQGSNILIQVQDNGTGFLPEQARKPHSYGLLGLRERANLLGGDVTIDSAPGHGACIRVRLPLPSQPDEPQQ